MYVKHKISLKLTLFILSVWMGTAHTLKAQYLPDYIINDKIYSTGTHAFCSAGYITSPDDPTHPDNYSGTSIVDYTAGHYISLLPGFKAGSYAPGGHFLTHFSIPGFPVMVMSPSTPGRVGQYEKLEYGLQLPSTIQNLVVNYFINNTTGVNPFDPDDINIEATFTSPSGTQNRLIYGFFYKGFKEQLSDSSWVPQPTPYKFRVRFAPTELGTWSCTIKVSSPNGKFSSVYADCLYFICDPSSNNGYVEIGHDGRHLRFGKTHQSFFPVGQNIPWIERAGFDNSNVFYSTWFLRFNNHITNLGANQGNFVRFLMNAGGHGIEWEKLGDYSTCDEYDNTMTSTGGTQDRQHNAFELDRVFDICHQQGIYMDLNVEMHSGYVEYNTTINPDQQEYYSWSKNKLHAAPIGLSLPVQALSDATAKKYFKRRLRYIIARWGYSTNLAVIELLSEQDGWTGFSPSVRSDSYDWHHEMASYIKSSLGETHHLLSTSYAIRPSGIPIPINNFHVPEIDVTSGHKYGSGRDVNVDQRFKYLHQYYGLGGATTEALYEDLGKPTIFGEMGLDGKTESTVGAPSYVDGNDLEGCNDVNFHNGMWASASMGSYGTGLNWWQEKNDAYRSQNFPALRAFFDAIDFESNTYNICYAWSDLTIPLTDHKYEVLGMRNFSASKLMGWAHDATYWWGNISTSCPDRQGLYGQPTSYSDNDHVTAPVIYGSTRVAIGIHLVPGFGYDIDWHRTRGAGGIYSSTHANVGLFGNLKPFYPGLYADFQFMATRSSHIREDDHLTVLLSDTLECGEDTIAVDATQPEDTMHLYSYHWNFGNGQTASVATATVIYSAPGSYSVSLVITDTLGNADTLKQIIVIPNCSGMSRLSGIEDSPSLSNQPQINISPNPNSGAFTLLVSGEGEKQVFIYNVIGKMIYENDHVTDRSLSLDISDQTKGIYFVKVIFGTVVKTEKIINQ